MPHPISMQKVPTAFRSFAVLHKMDEISSDIEACKSPSAEPSDISRVLLRLQQEINWQFLRPYSVLDRENFIRRLWNFLLFAAAHANTSIRLGAYRTTGAFLLKIAPYYQNEIIETFQDICTDSTKDMKSSAIIASSFAFISNFTALPYLQDFLKKTPVFHHFSFTDQTFSDHLAPIIRNLGRLGIEWLTTLLHSFLEKAGTSNDRYLILAISAIIKHDPLKLMNELLEFLREQSQVEDDLGLISYLLTSIDCNFESLDLRDVGQAAAKILANLNESNATEIDSAFQILAIKSPSFNVDIQHVECESNDENDNNEYIKINLAINDQTQSVIIPITPYLNRPSFFLLPLPLDVLHIKQNDGVLQLTSKFKTMAKYINNKPTTKEERALIFEQFYEFLSKKYNDITSACMQGFAICLPTLLKHSEEFSVINLVKHAIFAQPQSWFHSSDILRVIKNIPYSYYRNVFKITSIIDVLIGFSMSTNNKLYTNSLKVISNIINNTDFAKGTLYIAKQVDFFDHFKLERILSILISSISANIHNSSLDHLNYIVLGLLEYITEYHEEKNLFITILKFFSCFNLEFVDIQQLRPCFLDAFAIVHASLSLLTGLQWDSKLDQARIDNAKRMIEEDMRMMNYDIISETVMDYSRFLSPFAASLKFIYALPTKMVQLKFILNLFSRTLNLFPYQSALFALKYWDGFEDIHRNEIIQRVYPTLEFVQDYQTSAIWCTLFLTMNDSEFVEQLIPCKNILHKIASFAIDHNEFYCEFYAFEIYIHDDITPIFEKLQTLNDNKHDILMTYLNDNYIDLVHKLHNEPTSKEKAPKRLSIEFSDESVTSLVDAPPAGSHLIPSDLPDRAVMINQKINTSPSNMEQIIQTEFNNLNVKFNSNVSKELLASPLAENDIKNPVIKTQLKMQTYHFTDEQIHKLIRLYIDINDINGLEILIKYAFAQRRLIHVKGLLFPIEVIPLLIKYMIKLQSPELNDFVKYYQNSVSSAEIKIQCWASNPNEYFEDIKNKYEDHLTKTELAEFSKVVLKIPVNKIDLIQFSLRMMKNCKSTKRCQFILNLLNATFSKSEFISQQIVDQFFQIINEKIEIIPGAQVSRCILTLSQRNEVKNNSNEFISFVKKLFPKCEGKASGIIRLRQSILISNEITAENQLIFVSTFLKSELPSLISNGASFMFNVMKILMDSTIANGIKQNLPTIIDVIQRFRNDYPVSEDLGIVLVHILNNPLYNQFYPLILDGCSKLIPSYEQASFAALSMALPRLIIIHTELTDDLLKLFKISDSLLTKPGSYFLFKIYILALRARANKAETTQQKESFISDNITSWMQHCKEYDCYQMSELVYEWENLIFQMYGLEQLLSIICYQFFKYMPRFLPLFIAFSRFVRRYIKVASQDDKDSIEEALKGAAMMNSQKSHALSLLLITKTEYYITALDLATFPEDCPESESIINSNPEFINLLEKNM